MILEDALIAKIKEKYKSIRQFALHIGVPYTTVKSGLANGIGGMAVDTVIKMAKALEMTVDELCGYDTEETVLTEEEKRLLKAYDMGKQKNSPAVSAAVDLLEKVLLLSEQQSDEKR